MAEVSESEPEFSLVCTSDFIFCDSGDEVVLSCRLNPAISAVSMEIRWRFKADQICHYKNGQMNLSRGYEGQASLQLQDLHEGNVSLTLRDVRRSQKGLYICEVIHKNHSVREYIFLHIRSEDFSLVAYSGTVYSYPGEDVVLPVHLSPETSAASMDVRWFRGTELIYQYRNGLRLILNNDSESRVDLSVQELQRGNLSLTLRNVQLSDSGNYICTVVHGGCVKAGVIHLQVRDLKENMRDHLLDYIRHVLREFYNMEKTLKLLEEALADLDMDKKGKTETSEVELEEDRTTETELMEVLGPWRRRRNSTEGIRPLMGEESSDQNTQTQTRAGNTVTEQELPSPAEPSLLLQRERQSAEYALLQSTQHFLVYDRETLQHPRFFSATQSHEQDRTSPTRNPSQTSRRPENPQSYVLGPWRRRRNSTEGIRPLMESESSDQNTTQTRAGNTVTEQELTSSAVPSLLLRRERSPANPITQRVQETRQERDTIQHTGSLSATQSLQQERTSPPPPGNPPQTSRRRENRARRRSDPNCQIL